tara:strand:- start:1647 stop:3563 length:1917 start_codon:yes stop_codon:yes gene_type:complete
MAEDLTFKGKLDAGGVVDGLDDINKALAVTKEEAAGVNKELEETKDKNRKKDWKGLLDIFNTVLPRGLQRSIRGFQGTSRAVRRASTSFKALSLSIAALGIPLLILALTWLIENWSKISDFFTGTTEGMKDLAKATKAATDATQEFAASNDSLVRSFERVGITAEQRIAAYNELKKVLVEANDLDVTTAEGQREIIKLYKERLRQEALQTLMTQQQNALGEAKKRLLEAENESIGKWNEAHADVLRLQKALNTSTDEFVDLKMTQNERAEEHRIKVEEEAAAQKAAMLAENARKKSIDEVNNSRLTGQKMIEDFANWERTVHLVGQKRQEEELQIQYERQKAQATDTLKDEKQLAQVLLNLETQHQVNMGLLRDDFAQQQIDREDAEAQRLLDKANQDYITLQDQQDKINQFLEYSQLDGPELAFEKEKDAIVAAYEERFLLAEDNFVMTKKLESQQKQELLDAEESFEKAKTKIIKKQDDARRKAREQVVDTTLKGIGSLISAGEDNEAAQRAFAITEILINQGRAFASALAGATAAAAATGPAAPFTLAGYIASMFGALTASFAQIKSIMASADADVPGGSIDPRPSTVQQALIPGANENQNFNGGDLPVAQAYVVQSQLEGQQLLSNRVARQTTL